MATALPETPPNTTDPTTVVDSAPPRTRCISSPEKRSSSSPSLPSMIRVPARMKKGSASIGKDWVCGNICCTTSSSGMLPVPEQRDAGGDDQRMRHRDHRHHQRDEGDDQGEAHVGISSGLGCGMASGPMSAMRMAVVTVPRASSTQPAAIAQ